VKVSSFNGFVAAVFWLF